MSWEDQGRQDHGYFGHGTAPKIIQRRGGASFYDLPGKKMANGKIFDPSAMTAAMLDVPFGTQVKVLSLKDPNRSVDVIITDRGPYVAGRIIDLTPKAFEKLFGSKAIGVGDVVVAIPSK